MLASTALVDQIGGAGNARIYLGRPPQNAVRPFIVIRRDSTEQTYGTAGAKPYARTIASLQEIVMTMVVADDYEHATSINWLVRAAVETRSGASTGPWLVDSDTMDDEEDLSSGDNRFIEIATIAWRTNRASYPTVT